MTLVDLIGLARNYTRDIDSRIFTDGTIRTFINEGIDRVKHFNVFKDMSQLTLPADKVTFLPNPYHHMLALYASSRLFDIDGRYYEGTEKRNEFEHLFAELKDSIDNGVLEIFNTDGEVVENNSYIDDNVTDVYFKVVNKNATIS